MNTTLAHHSLGYDSPVDPGLQAQIETIDLRLRGRYGMSAE
jgi:hypothetical protein